MKSAFHFYFIVIATLMASAAEIPTHIRGDFESARQILASKHDTAALWPSRLDLGVTLRCPKPINSPEELKAVLATAPEAFNSGARFGDIVEFEGWFAASLDPMKMPPGKSMCAFGVVIQKGSSELCPFSHW